MNMIVIIGIVIIVLAAFFVGVWVGYRLMALAIRYGGENRLDATEKETLGLLLLKALNLKLTD